MPQIPPPSPPAASLHLRPLFRETLAGFLRHRRYVWAIRRTDRFSPLDIHLAGHHIALQGSIDAAAVNAFLDEYGNDLKIPPTERVCDGDRLTLAIPAVAFPKRQLLSFSVRDADGSALPMLSRGQGAPIAARDLLALLLRNKSVADPQLDDASTQQKLHTLISTLVFQDPHRLAERLEEWIKEKNKPRPKRRYRPWKRTGPQYELLRNYGLRLATSDLPDLALREWIAQEANDLLPDSASDIVDAVEKVLQREFSPDHTLTWIPSTARPDGLRYFATPALLLLHGVQDLLKTVIQEAPPWPTDIIRDPLGPRLALTSSAQDLGARVEGALEALPLLESLLLSQRDSSALTEFFRILDRWTAYVVKPVELGTPFVIKFDEILPLLRPQDEYQRLSWWMKKWRVIRTFHEYPLAERDALAVHVELVIEDPELRYGTAEVVEVRDAQRRRWPVHGVFSHELRPSSRLVHRYSSKRPERPTFGHADSAQRHLYLRVPVRLVGAIWAGYAGAGATFLAGAGYVLGVVVWSFEHHRDLADMVAPLTVGAVAATLSLWLTAIQHPKPIVYRKLAPARYLLYFVVGLTVLTLVSYGVRRWWFY